jgi:hypothetical protein
MTEDELKAIEKKADEWDAGESDSGYQAMLMIDYDIPALIAEIRRLGEDKAALIHWAASSSIHPMPCA